MVTIKKIIFVSPAVFLCLFFAPAAHASVSKAQTGVHTAWSTGNSMTSTFASAPATGDLVVVGINFYNGSNCGTLSSVKDGNGNSFTVTTATTTNAAQSGCAYIAYELSAPSNASNTITATFTTSPQSGSDIWADDFNLSGGTASLDSTSAGSANSGTTINKPSITVSTSSEILYGVASVVTGISSANSPWIGNDAGVASDGNYAEFDLSASASTTLNFTLSSGGYNSQGISFKIAGGVTNTGYTWTNGAGNNQWDTGENWSGGAVPGATSSVIFSASSSAPCTINTDASAAGITITSGYGGIITQSPGNSIIVGSSGWTQSGGTFVGSSDGDAITMNGFFSLTGGTFTSTDGDHSFYASSTFSGTFQDNSGTVVFGTTSTVSVVTGSTNFYNLWLGDGSEYLPGDTITVATGTVLSVSSTTVIGTQDNMLYLEGGGEINAQGNVLLNYHENGNQPYPTSTFNFVLDGTGTQTINDDGYSSNNIVPFVFQGLTINKPSGTVNFIGNFIDIMDNFTNDDGPSGINSNSSTIAFGGPNNIVTGSTNFYNLWLGDGSEYLPGDTITVATGTVLSVSSTTVIGTQDNMLYLEGGGEINAQGNVLLNYHENGNQPYPTSTFNFVLDGTGTQTINDDGYSSNNIVPFVFQGLTINKPSGVAVISSNFLDDIGGLAINNGELQLATGTSAGILEIDGAVTVSSTAVLSDYAQAASAISLGSSVTNNGLVFFDGSGEGCTAILPNYVTINSTTTGSQIPWSGSGNSVMRYVQVQDQGGSEPISIWNGTNNGNVGANWTFATGPEPQLIQSVTNSGGGGTTSLALPSFTFKSRAGDLIVVPVSAYNQTIAAPTDNAGNTYMLVASSTFGSSPLYALSLYYAKNITPSSSLIVTVHGNGGSGPLLSASAFEYTGMAPSSTLDTSSANTDTSASGTISLTSFSATGRDANELYFGTMTLSASTTANAESGWRSELGDSNNSTNQALYVEDVASSSELTTAATWTSATSTNYAAIMGIFRSPFSAGYAASGTLDSATFDTGVAGGVQLNSFIWQGNTPSNSSVKFQFAVSDSSGGPWNFEGYDGTANTYFSGSANTPINLVSTENGYALFNGYRYFRYRVVLFTDSTYAYTPTITQVTVNWSP